ncbi:MAG: hypothetical protein AAF353_04770 [Pseudomonadota bacterium]
MTGHGPRNVDGLNRFSKLWQSSLLPQAPDQSEQIYARLAAAYSEPHRYYHTMDHINYCLGQLDLCRSEVDNADAIEMAIWFHDVIYQPGNPDDERQSAALYADLAKGVHSDHFISQVYEMIIATIHDGESLQHSDNKYMVDIDLSSFALDWDAFVQDSENLRLENPHVEAGEYQRRQKKFRESLLARERFFYTDFFHQRYEQQARKNLQRCYQQPCD